MWDRIVKQGLFALALGVAIVAAVAPDAVAGPRQEVTVPAVLAELREPGSVSDFDAFDFAEPTGVYDVDLRHVRPSTGSAGFAWGSAAVGGALVLGLCLLAGGARAMVRRRRPAPGLQW